MKTFYAIHEQNPGSRTTLNGTHVDKLHAFESMAERKGFLQCSSKARAVKVGEAKRLAYELYDGAVLGNLATCDAIGVTTASPSELAYCE